MGKDEKIDQQQRHSLILRRPWEEGTFAIIHWESSSVDSPLRLRRAIRRALREYNKEEGELAFEDDYNIGDLMGDIEGPGSAAIRKHLSAQGVGSLSIASIAGTKHWEYDDKLAPDGLDIIDRMDLEEGK